MRLVGEFIELDDAETHEELGLAAGRLLTVDEALGVALDAVAAARTNYEEAAACERDGGPNGLFLTMHYRAEAAALKRTGATLLSMVAPELCELIDAP